VAFSVLAEFGAFYAGHDRGIVDRLKLWDMRLTPELLEACYRADAFPMADSFGRIDFYRADPRSVLELDELHVSKSLVRVLRRGTYEVRVDRDFGAVIRACADRPRRGSG
jgi:leucyl/phenylalanyl-tRNA--protein transferase